MPCKGVHDIFESLSSCSEPSLKKVVIVHRMFRKVVSMESFGATVSILVYVRGFSRSRNLGGIVVVTAAFREKQVCNFNVVVVKCVFSLCE